MAIEVGSADAPLENVSTKLLNVYRKGKSMIHLLCSFGELTRNLREPDVQKRLEQAKIQVKSTIDYFEKDMLKGCIIPKLTVAINPVIIESLLLGTIAHDAGRLPRSTWLDCDGPGIYAVGLAVSGRKGKFLRGIELLRVADAIAKYADGWDALQAPGPKTLQQHEEIKLAQRMEDGIMQNTRFSVSSFLRFIANPADAARVRLLSERLQSRANASLAIDPDSTTVMVQSPLYIGSSTDLKTCTADYELSNVARISKLLGLTVTAMDYCQYHPVLFVNPVLRIWDNNHLPIAERMISTLASSLVALDGFNATEAGGNPSSVSASTLSMMKQNVFLHECFHAENLRDTEAAFKSRIEYLDIVAALNEDQRRLEDRAAAMKKEIVSLVQDKPIRTASERDAELARLERQMAEINLQLDSSDRDLCVAEQLCQNLRPIIDWLVSEGLLSDEENVVVPGTDTTTGDDLETASAHGGITIPCTDDTIIRGTDSPGSGGDW